jgi:hypothetical protein
MRGQQMRGRLPRKPTQWRWRWGRGHLQPGRAVADSLEDRGEGAPRHAPNSGAPILIPGRHWPDETVGDVQLFIAARGEEVHPPAFVVVGGPGGIYMLLRAPGSATGP